MISFSEPSEGDYLILLTRGGFVKRTPMSAFANVRGSLSAIKLRVSLRCDISAVYLTDGSNTITALQPVLPAVGI
jgi:DNA gyrase/topoisomerase IV subunit A